MAFITEIAARVLAREAPRNRGAETVLEALGLTREAVGFGLWVLGDSAADQTHHPLPTTHALKPIAHSERLWAWRSALARDWQWGVHHRAKE